MNSNDANVPTPNTLEKQDETLKVDSGNVNVCKLLNSEYHMYSYITADNEHGSIIVDSDISKLFEDQVLFEMDKLDVKRFTLKDLLEKGFVSSGTTDIMETLEIKYPNKIFFPHTKPKIVGKYMHGSRKRLIGEKLNIEFDYEPESDHEYTNYDDEVDVDVNVDTKIESKVDTDKTKYDWLL